MTVPLSLSVVITNYNTTALTLRCLQGIRDHFVSRPAEVIVVDDASAEKLRGLVPPEITLVENATNQGYVRSVNIGVARATGDLILLLDSDAAPLCDAMAAAVARFSENRRLGGLGFHLVDQGGARTGASQPEPRAWGLAVGQQLEARLLSYVERVSSPRFTIHSCALAFRRAAFVEIGGFDEGFDFLDADTDFSMRLWRAGWELSMEQEARILHEGSGSPQTTTRRVIRFHVNRWRLLEKHGLISHPLLLKGALAARHLAELVWLSGRGRFRPDERALWRDKASGRRQLLNTVWKAYQATG